MKCERCDDDVVTVNLTIPVDLSREDGAQEIVGCMERYCLLHYNKVYGLTKQQEDAVDDG